MTIDAMGTPNTLQEPNADYVLSVKENQEHLFEDISVLLGVDQEQNFKYATLEYHKCPELDLSSELHKRV